MHEKCGGGEIMKKFIQKFTCVLALCTAVCLFGGAYVSEKIPDSVIISADSSFSVDSRFITVSNQKSEKAAANNVGESLYQKQINLFGIIPIKNVEIQLIPQKYVVIGGTPFGMKIFTKGVMVVGMSDVETKSGLYNPAKDAGIRLGDVITEIDGVSVSSNSDVSDIIAGSGGKRIKMKISREGKALNITFRAAKSLSDGCYKAGLWVRDSSAGIGTLTFYIPETKTFAGLGHAICDVDTGLILPISSGEIVEAEINSINKSHSGQIGELCGSFKESSLGKMTINCESGVYGKMESYQGSQLVEIASKNKIKSGSAKIYTTLDNDTPKYYDCEIESVDFGGEESSRDMIIKITDKRLIRKTGGIVQGMSGSPIVQDGKLVGAVTHVLVNDPTRGYAIFAENMLETAKNSEQLKKAG
jgi:stage IV sporulation protein B